MKKLMASLAAALALVLIVPGFVSASPESPGKDIVKYVFVHYAASNKPAKPPTRTDAAYSLYKGGVKWADGVVVSYDINTAGAPTGAAAAIQASFDTWDAETSRNLFAHGGGSTSKRGAAYDQENTISWDSIPQSGVIAMTTFWVNTFTKRIVEFDIEFNTYYPWGTSGASGVMDVQNIATHEIGHTLVLNDLYQAQYSAQTMYGYSDFGDIEKRTLESGDIAGIRALYGN